MSKSPASPITPLGVYEKLLNISEDDSRVSFIFGAGASAGYSRSSGVYAPPVVRDLFSDSNAAVKTVIRGEQHETILRRRDDIEDSLQEHRGDLEDYLGKLLKQNTNNDLFNRLLLYLQDVCFLCSQNIDKNRETNNYLRLIYRMERLKGVEWSSVTFNYDTILEKTFVAAGSDSRTFSSIGQYDIQPKVIKVHGGINFRYQVAERSAPIRPAGDIFRLMMSFPQNPVIGAIKPLPDLDNGMLPPLHSTTRVPRLSTPALSERMENYDFPVMMVPVHNTNRAETEFFQQQMDAALEEIRKSDLVVAVGYNFGDRVFLEGLKKLDTTKKEIVLVSNKDLSSDPDSSAAYTAVAELWQGKISIFQGAGFSEFVDSIGPIRPSPGK